MSGYAPGLSYSGRVRSGIARAECLLSYGLVGAFVGGFFSFSFFGGSFSEASAAFAPGSLFATGGGI